MKEITYVKNYNKLLKYAESQHIKVIYTNCNSCAQWFPTRKTIELSHDFTGKPAELAFFLHELGHARDDASMRDKGYVKYLDLCYKRFNKLTQKVNNKNITITLNQKMSVIYTEDMAWENGIDIAKALGIRLGKWFYNEQKESMTNYFQFAFPQKWEQKYKEFLNE